MSKLITCGIYIRVSTVDQNVQNQYDVLKEYCKVNDYSIYDFYIDKGESGLKDSRPAFNRLMKDVRSRKFNAVVIWKLDRIGRSVQHLLQILQEFKRRKINFIVTTQNMDTSSPEGKLFYTMVGAFAEFESNLISQRTKLGMKRARSQGKHIGRPKKNPAIYNHYCNVSGCRIRVEQNRRLCDAHRKQYGKLLQKKGGVEN